MTTIVYAYGCAPRTDIPEEVDEQLRLAHDFWNQLVELELRHENALDAMWREYPEAATLMERVDTAEALRKQLREQVRGERVNTSTVLAAKARAVELRTVEAGLKKMRAELRVAKNKAEVKESSKPRKAHLLEEHKGRVKAARIEAANRGLYWGTYNQVLADMKVAINGVIRKRTNGEPAKLRFQRWDGTGTLAVQLQRQAGNPVRDPRGLAERTTRWRNVFSLSPWIPPAEFDAMSRPEQRRIARTGRVRMNVGHDRVIEIPVMVHRMLPPDADVLTTSLSVTRVAGQRRISISVTIALPDPEPVTDGPRVSVTLGWTSIPTGIRVATLTADQPLRIPADIADLVHPGPDPHTVEVIVPGSWCNRLDSAIDIRSCRDKALDEIRPQLVHYLREHPDSDPEHPTAADVARWRAPARFAAVALRWRNAAPPEGARIAAELESWRRTDRRRWEAETHTRRRALGARRDGYRRIAAWLARECGQVTMSSVQLDRVARRTDVGVEEAAVPEVVAQRARQQRVLVAPSELRDSIGQACRRDGVTVVASGEVPELVPEIARSA